MNPDLEFFLEDALEGIQPTSDLVGRVVVEPDYEADISPKDGDLLAEQLLSLLHAQALRPDDIRSFDGMEVEGLSKFQPLYKYIRRVTLHAEKSDGAWIEVAPPGYWI